MPRPDRLLVVVGTGTEVGKTWASAELARRWRADGYSVAARKPAQSFEPGDLTDAEVLASATAASPTEVCPAHRWFDVPMAPPMAAEVLGRPPFTIADLVEELRWSDTTDVGLVESAGGVRSPIADDGDSVALARHLDADGAILVADAGLGTISDVRLAVGALLPLPVLVLLNRFDRTDGLHERNRRWLVDRDGYRVDTDVGAMAARGFDWCRPS